jgi:hypothetical protein
VDIFEKVPLPNVNPKMLKELKKHVKTAISIIGLNLVDNQLTHITSYILRTHEGVKEFLQHSQDEEFVQHPLRL